VKHSLASVDKLRAAGFTPRWNFAEGLKATVEHFRNLATPPI
jgi:nucleoside-diphosphate-sugar epimerase